MDAAVLPYQPERNIVQVKLAPDVSVSMANLERNFYTTSSCGICGKASLLALRTVCPPRAVNGFQVAAQVLYSLPARLRDAQKVFQRTGGLHAAGLFDSTGQLFSSREDVGRHNAVDKLSSLRFPVPVPNVALSMGCGHCSAGDSSSRISSICAKAVSHVIPRLIGRLFRKALCYACFTLGGILGASNITVPSGVLD